MANNISKDYISFSKKCFIEYLKMILENKYKKDISNLIIDKYIDIRYYNDCEREYHNLGANINYYLKDFVNEMINKMGSDYKDSLKWTYESFKYLLYLDDVYEYDSLKKFVLEVDNFRKNIHQLDNENFINDFAELIKRNIACKKNYLKASLDDKIKLINSNTNIKNIYYSDIICDFKFPKIYSSYSIKKVFNKGIVNEDRLIITYHMVNDLILKNILSGIYDKYYIVDFPCTIISKVDKVYNLFNIVDDDSVRDNIIINIKYNYYLENKDLFDEYIKKGFRFCASIDKSFKYDEKDIIRLDIFSYIIGFENIALISNVDKIIIRK